MMFTAMDTPPPQKKKKKKKKKKTILGSRGYIKHPEKYSRLFLVPSKNYMKSVHA